MKQFAVGLLTIVALAIVGFYAFRGTTKLMSNLLPTASPSASPITSSTPAPSATPIPKSTPAPTYIPTTKGGLVKGVTTTKTTVTTSTTHTKLTLIKTSSCPANFTSEIRDITAPLTLRYALKDGYATNVIVWKKNGAELLSKREIRGSGELMKIENTDYAKIEIQSTACSSTSDTWLTITAER